MPGTFDTVAQFLAAVMSTDGLPHFSFRQMKNSGKYEIWLRNFEGFKFPSEKIPSIIIGFNGIPDGIGYKMNPNANMLMKSDET